jgi:RNA polymerase sigma-70 factor (ECF subfamily)
VTVFSEQLLAEVFGFPIDNESERAKRYRDNKLCPFNNIVSNCTNDYFRKQKNKPIQYMSDFNGDIEDEDSFLESISTEHVEEFQFSSHYSKEVLTTIEQGLELLPLRQKEAFLLRYLEEFSTTETAGIMKCSEGTVKTHCSRACIFLSDFLKKRGIN